jgi:hypothetical protein
MVINISIGFIGALTILFIALKLLNKITWSWLWVLSPLWITAIIVIIILIIIIIATLIGVNWD